MNLFDKTSVINMCCICLKKSDEFSKTLYNNGLYYKLTVSIPEMRFELLNINQFICDDCADSVNDIYNFRNKCLLNKPVFIDSLIKHKEQQFQIETEKRCAKVAKRKTTEKHPMLIQQLSVAPVNTDPALDDYIRNNDDDPIVIKEESETETESEGEILPDIPARTKRKRYNAQEQSVIQIQSERQKQLEIQRQSETQTQLELQRQSEIQTQLELKRQSEVQRQLETNVRSPSVIRKQQSGIQMEREEITSRRRTSSFTQQEQFDGQTQGELPERTQELPSRPETRIHTPGELPEQMEELPSRSETRIRVQGELPSRTDAVMDLQTNTRPEIEAGMDVRVVKTEPEYQLESDDYHTETDLKSEIKIEPETFQKYDFLEHSESTETAKSEAFLDEEWLPIESLANQDAPGGGIRKKYPCLECDRSFDEEFQLQLHQVVHITRIQYSCNQCNKTFNHISALNKHRQSQSHNQIKPFKCSKCCAAFSQKNQLLTHSAVHASVKNYECVECQRTFSSNEYLKKHMLTHTGLRPYKCSMCDKTFTQSSNLSRHERLHEKKGSSLYIQPDVRYN